MARGGALPTAPALHTPDAQACTGHTDTAVSPRCLQSGTLVSTPTLTCPHAYSHRCAHMCTLNHGHPTSTWIRVPQRRHTHTRPCHTHIHGHTGPCVWDSCPCSVSAPQMMRPKGSSPESCWGWVELPLQPSWSRILPLNQTTPALTLSWAALWAGC